MTRCVIPILLAVTSYAGAAPRLVELPGKSPLITIRIVFTTGAASDPADKPGLAHLTGDLLGEGGTKDLTYKQVVDAMYPMATSVSVYSDKEMTTFVGATHLDNLDRFYGLMRDMILKPGWRTTDFERLRDDAVNDLRVSLRGNNDEELGKEELYNIIYAGRAYGHEDLGTVAALQKMTLADVQKFYRDRYTQSNVIIGIAGGYPPEFARRIKRDFSSLPAGTPSSAATEPATEPPLSIERNRVTILQKDTRAVAWSFGFPIDVKRGDPDYPALLVAQSYLGQHRESGGVLFQRLRELRGLNYGDYAYIEYFPRGMFRLEPEPNIARLDQIFQIWIRPVEPQNAVFALRGALFELDHLIKNGIPEKKFDEIRQFLPKFVNVLTKTKSAELGYAIDSLYYGIPNYNDYIKNALARLTAEDVNRAVRKHLRADNLEIVAVAGDGNALRSELTGDAPTPIHYIAVKPTAVLEEDKAIERWPLHLRPQDVRILSADSVFEDVGPGLPPATR